MANVRALRDKIEEFARGPKSPMAGRFSVNDLYVRVGRHFDGEPPVSRATFYTWFRESARPSQSILECIPAFAAILDVPEYEMWSAAGVLTSETEAALALGSVAHDLRRAYRRMRKTLSENGLSTAGEALVVDRIMHYQLDYRITIWPVVRGTDLPLHLHSWIVLEPIPRAESTRRVPTTILQDATPDQRRRFIREEVITEGLWRTLGLKWRDRMPEEFEHLGGEPLFIEVPVEERGRPPSPDPAPGTTLDRLLVLGAPWAHAELMAALLADALRFGSWDLRYIGFPADRGTEAKEQFCRQKLDERRPGFVWAIAQRYDLMERLRTDILDAVEGAPVVVVTYGQDMVNFAATALRATRHADVGKALAVVNSLVFELRELTDVIHVEIADEDVLVGQTGELNPEPFVRDLAVDLIRHLTAQVLDVLRSHELGPGIRHWGSRFDDLRLAHELSVHSGRSTVSWLPRTVPSGDVVAGDAVSGGVGSGDPEDDAIGVR